MITIRKALKSGLLIFLLLASCYLLYLSSKQDYNRFSPTRDLGRPTREKPEDQENDYMDFINKPPIELPSPF